LSLPTMHHASAFTAFASPTTATSPNFFYPPHGTWHPHVYVKPNKKPTPHSIADILSLATSCRDGLGDTATVSPTSDMATDGDIRSQRHHRGEETGSDSSVASVHSEDDMGLCHQTAMTGSHVTVKGRQTREVV